MTDREIRSGERPAAHPPAVDLGGVLRRAREKRGLGLEDLARALRLEPRIVGFIENNAFERLPAPAFIRGYVRAICKELAVDGAPLLAALDERFGDAAPALSDFASRAPVQVTSDSRIVRYTTVAVVLVMVVMVALWWRAHEPTAPALQPAGGVPPAAPAIADTPPLPYRYDVVQHPDDPFYRAEEGASLDLGDAARHGAAAVTPALSADATSADIVIAAREDTWIQVLDVNGERLYYNIVRAGNQIEIQGRRPYSLVIGNAPAVSLLFEGKTVDVEAIADEGVARFQLGQDRITQ